MTLNILLMAYLRVMADEIIDMTTVLLKGSVKMVDDVSAFGLWHVGHGVRMRFLGFRDSLCRSHQYFLDIIVFGETLPITSICNGSLRCSR